MFKVLQIDHVELFVPDRYDAAKWYERVLGLQIVPEWERNPDLVAKEAVVEVTTYEYDDTSAWIAST